MIVKLVNPLGRGNVMTFAAANEVYYEPAGALTRAEQDALVQHWEGLGYDVRRYAAWDGAHPEALAMTLVTMPAKRGAGERAIVVLTNYNAWLCTPEGRSIDRIHRHEA